MEKCLLEEKDCIDCGECDRCDLSPTKLCDNCCKCIESDADYMVVDAILKKDENSANEN